MEKVWDPGHFTLIYQSIINQVQMFIINSVDTWTVPSPMFSLISILGPGFSRIIDFLV